MIPDPFKISERRHGALPSFAAVVLPLFIASSPALLARPWSFVGIPQPVEAELVSSKNGGVVLQGPNGKSFEVPITSFSPTDQQYLKWIEKGAVVTPTSDKAIAPITSRTGYKVTSVEKLTHQVVLLTGAIESHITGTGDPITGSTFNFTGPDGWLFLDNIAPSTVASKFLTQMLVNGTQAALDTNVRVVQYGSGTVVIPQGPDFAAMTVYEGKSTAGDSAPLKCYVAYDDAKLHPLKGKIGSFVLKRGYTATLAQQSNGTGVSKNYVAQDHDLVINNLPKGLDEDVRFIRIFPWRWVSKKGICGGIWQNLNVAWFYDWNIGANSSLDHEYVAIRQNRGWPSLNQDWKAKGMNHLLGYNEPDKSDQSKLTVDDAIHSWPDLLATGMRVGAPAPSDGGLNWLYQFIDKADAAELRVDFVPVHYYRATADPGDAKGAAEQLHQFLKGVHDRVKRPLWVTEWNNGANWTTAPDPNAKQQKAAVAAMMKMLDETPFVERYSLYNWVEDVRKVVSKDNSLTPAGEVYRDKVSPLSYIQTKGEK